MLSLYLDSKHLKYFGYFFFFVLSLKYWIERNNQYLAFTLTSLGYLKWKISQQCSLYFIL